MPTKKKAIPLSTPEKTDLLRTPEETADRLRVTAGTLSVWRSTRRYALAWVKVGSKIFYRDSDIEAFLNSRTVDGQTGKAVR